MKKVKKKFCLAFLILISCLFIRVPVHAQENACTHEYSGTYATTRYKYSSHQYQTGNGSSGPTYGTCIVSTHVDGLYPRCVKCGAADYAHPIWEVILDVVHSACGL